ncbi:MAG: anthranilate phosphoribosyltransferase [Lysobacterales bacterium]
MAIVTALNILVEGRDLSADQAAAAMRQIMAGEASPAQIGAYLVALRMKGETATEIAASAQVMRALALAVELPRERLIDIVGTGGDGASIFNVSTAASFVAAAGGARVAKHGNRSVSSKSGSADVLEAAGVNLALDPEQVAECVRRLGVGFLFAPRHHGAMRHAIGPRRELGLRTLFNLLGPLTNPARAPRQVLGVYDRRWLRPLAEVMRELGSEHVLVVHAEDGLDEFSIAAATRVAELRDGEISEYPFSPEQAGIDNGSLAGLRVADAAESLVLLRQALAGSPGPASDIVALNAGAGLYVAGLAASIAAGVARAREVMADGAAVQRFNDFVEFTGRLRGRA